MSQQSTLQYIRRDICLGTPSATLCLSLFLSVFLANNLMAKSVPSLTNPPGAPKKKKVTILFDLEKIPKLQFPEEDAVVGFDYSSWRRTINMEMVREHFFSVLPEEVSEETDENILNWWLNLYSPQSQPQTEDEHLYIAFICKAVRNRKAELLANPPSPNLCRKSFVSFI